MCAWVPDAGTFGAPLSKRKNVDNVIHLWIIFISTNFCVFSLSPTKISGFTLGSTVNAEIFAGGLIIVGKQHPRKINPQKFVRTNN